MLNYELSSCFHLNDGADLQDWRPSCVQKRLLRLEVSSSFPANIFTELDVVEYVENLVYNVSGKMVECGPLKYIKC